MRPVHLRIAGLHSFRQSQSIDFEPLCTTGVFGIFGPTGSGKSSILDAITLALYGKVERAAHSTRGIMNMAENTMSVSFTFELGTGNARRRYRVERRFSRQDEQRIQTNTCRFIDETVEAYVLADKKRDVDEQVERLLGLTIDDFTRAVVLPQGKFAEFLQLKGAERRQMLQRLFHLYRYGDHLHQRLKKRLDTAQQSVTQIEAEQQGLGNASQFALHASKKNVAEQEKQVTTVARALSEAESVYQQLQQIWQWQSEKQQVEAELKQLEAQKHMMEERMRHLRLAEEAERLRPYVHDVYQAQAHEKHWREQLQVTTAQLQQATEREKMAREALRLATQRRKEEGPALVARMEQLDQAAHIEEELQQLQQQVSEKNELVQRLEQEWITCVEKQKKAAHMLEKAQKRQRELQNELERVTVAAPERRQLQQAHDAKQYMESFIRQERDIMQEISDHEQQYRHVLEEHTELERRLQRLNRKGSATLTKTTSYLAVLQRMIDWQMQWQSEVEDHYTRYQQQQEAVQTADMARQLAQKLQHDCPCPVCGSLHHPQPATKRSCVRSDDAGILDPLLKKENDLQNPNQPTAKKQVHDAVASWRKEMGVIGTALQHMRFQLQQAIQQLQRGEGNEGHVADADTSNDTLEHDEMHDHRHGSQHTNVDTAALPDVQKSFAQMAAALSEPFRLNREQDRDSGRAQLKELKTAIRTWSTYVHTLRADVQRCLDEADSVHTECQHNQKTMHQLAARLRDRQSMLQKTNARRKQIQETIETERQNWRKQYSPIPFEAVEKHRRELANKDEQATAIRKRLEDSVHYIEERTAEVERLEQMRTERHVQFSTAAATLNEQKRYMSKRQAELARWTGGQPLAELQRRVQRALDQLQQEEETCQSKWNEAQQSWQQSEKAYSVAKQSLSQATDRLRQANERWEEMVTSTVFTSISSVQEYEATEQERRQWQAEIDQYEQAARHWQHERERLAKQLADRSITEREWQACTEQLEIQKQEYERTKRLLARAERDLEQIQERHERYQQLEKDRIKWSAALGQLQQLQTVLQGNRFVEFMAEEQLVEVARDASARMAEFTRGRFAMEVDSGGGFLIRDDGNGGIRRPVSSLSGGETFLTSLALALSLSAQIQLRGKHPLQFFFLDEGFGTLDAELLDTVMTALEKLHQNAMTIGVISHVPELRERMPRCLRVEPATPGGDGSRVFLDGV